MGNINYNITKEWAVNTSNDKYWITTSNNTFPYSFEREFKEKIEDSFEQEEILEEEPIDLPVTDKGEIKRKLVI